MLAIGALALGFSSHPVVEPPPPPYCPPGKIPYGVLFTFGSADVGYNNLGGYPGGPDVKCTVGPHSDSASSTCGNSAAERPCGCGCDCRETAAYTEGPYGFGAPSPEIRFQGGGLFFDGTIEGMQGTPFDVALTNSSSYKPWASDSNGRGRDPTGHGFASVSMAANTETTFALHAYRPGTNTPQPLGGEGNVCVFDFDNGVDETLKEEFHACGIVDWFAHGKSPRALEGRAMLQGLCPNIDTENYLDVASDAADPTNPDRHCIEIKAKMEGTGVDNPKNVSSVLIDCSLYDQCPANGLSPAPDKQDRPPIGVQDTSTCAGGSTAPAAGVYPDTASPERLQGQPYRWTVPKFACFSFVASEGFEFTYKVGPSSDGFWGRNFLFSGYAQPYCIDAPIPTPSPSPSPSPSPPISDLCPHPIGTIEDTVEAILEAVRTLDIKCIIYYAVNGATSEEGFTACILRAVQKYLEAGPVVGIPGFINDLRLCIVDRPILDPILPPGAPVGDCPYGETEPIVPTGIESLLDAVYAGDLDAIVSCSVGMPTCVLALIGDFLGDSIGISDLVSGILSCVLPNGR